MKKYGIYLLFPPEVNLKSEGLGRYLAALLKASLANPNVKFVIACPSWMHPTLQSLLKDFGLELSQFELISPAKSPFLIRYYFALKNFYTKLPNIQRQIFRVKNRIRRERINKPFPFINVAKNILASRNTLIGLVSLPFILIYFVLSLIVSVTTHTVATFLSIRNFYVEKKSLIYRVLSKFKLHKYKSLKTIYNKIPRAVKSRKKKSPHPLGNISCILKLFKIIQVKEALYLNKLINNRSDIDAWYCPTIFWPEVTLLNAPTLICVPDVVVDFCPVGFAMSYGSDLHSKVNNLRSTISQGEYFITYSEDVKINTLMKNYNINSDKIFVIRHGNNDLSQLIINDLIPSSQTDVIKHCQSLVTDAINKTGHIYSGNIKFIFYASQNRPNKNILSLLKAYNILLKQHYINLKLVLTADRHVSSEILQFIGENNLHHEILFLSGLSSEQLAACYKLAELTVNPSLSEGGFPFTFNESLSVNTPTVMANINVTTEIIKNPELQKMMLFDPYNVNDIVNKIAWGLQNKQTLLEQQTKIYEELSKRTWEDVIDEHIQALDQISNSNKFKSAEHRIKEVCLEY